MTSNTAEILNTGIECLEEKLGNIGAERFLYTYMRERFDYTEWQHEYFDEMKPGEFHEKALEYAKTHTSW